MRIGMMWVRMVSWSCLLLSASHQFLLSGHELDSNEILQTQFGYKPQSFTTEEEVWGVVGGPSELPCHTAPPPQARDSVRLVLWFKDDSARPIYTYDTRGKGDQGARHWSNSSALGGRGFFRGSDVPGVLVLDKVLAGDAGLYTCRVDFYRAPTQISRVALNVIVPPEKPRIFNERDEEIRLSLGPYRIGDRVVVRCESWGGSPPPQLFWWRDHALLDSSYESLGPQKVMNTLILENLTRSDLHAILTCQASNNNVSAPVSSSVKIDMHFGPLSVQLMKGRDSLSAGKRFEAKCEVVGARPPPRLTWWRGANQIRENITTHTSPDGNVTLSSVTFIPSVQDAGKLLLCRAVDQQTGEGGKEDGWKLNINYVPQTVLSLGSSLNGSNIKEGDDVYFECNVRSNPRPYKISWRRNEAPLVQNLAQGVIISNQSLVIQRVGRDQSGIYTCLAHNSEGDGVSNPVTLNVRYSPYCKPDQVLVYGVARYEKIRISCEVSANPSSSLSYHWVFNTTADNVHIDQSAVRVEGTRSTIEYIPRSELDYGTFLCWGRNSVGVQREPCSFHLIPAGKPDPLHNCTVHSQTFTALSVTCGAGFDGGLPQTFHLVVRSADSAHLHTNQSGPRPEFHVTNLRPGEGYILTLFAANGRGASEPMTLHAFTTRDASSRHVVVADTSRQPGGGAGAINGSGGRTVTTPVLAVLIAMGAGLALVALCIIVAMRVKHNQLAKYTRAAVPIYKGTGSNSKPDVVPVNKEYIEEEEAFTSFHETRYATVGRQRPEPDCDASSRIRHNLSRLSQEVTYAELTLPRGRGYSQMRRLDSPALSARLSPSFTRPELRDELLSPSLRRPQQSSPSLPCPREDTTRPLVPLVADTWIRPDWCTSTSQESTV